MYRQTLDKIISSLIYELGLDNINIDESSKLSSDLDISSLEFLNFIMVLEEELDVTFEEERLKKFKTVGDIAIYVENLRS